jgi:hypothetical protein
MTSDREDESSAFSDPPLKLAVVQAWGPESAPYGLRARVQDVLRSHPPFIRQPLPASTLRQSLMWSLAAGIAIVLFVQIKSFLPTSPPPPPPKLTALPTSLYDNLVLTHDRCNLQSPNHHKLAVAQTDDAAIAKAMQKQLSQAVLMARPAGWTFRGAAICSVGETPSGHLLFAKGPDVLSIFSLPDWSVEGLTDGSHFETTNHGHAIVAFSRNDGLFCIVASGTSSNITLSQLVDLRTTMEAAVSGRPGCAAGPSMQPPPELLVAASHR